LAEVSFKTAQGPIGQHHDLITNPHIYLVVLDYLALKLFSNVDLALLLEAIDT
jgi:hypothetical protein